MDESHPYGTYAKLLLDDQSIRSLVSLIKNLSLPNPVPADSLHTTVLYSRKPIPEAVELNSMAARYQGKVSGLARWPTQDGKTCLVALIDCRPAIKLHDRIKDHYGATWDFPQFHPHVTLSYDVDEAEYMLPAESISVSYTTVVVSAIKPPVIDESTKSSKKAKKTAKTEKSAKTEVQSVQIKEELSIQLNVEPIDKSIEAESDIIVAPVKVKAKAPTVEEPTAQTQQQTEIGPTKTPDAQSVDVAADVPQGIVNASDADSIPEDEQPDLKVDTIVPPASEYKVRKKRRSRR